MCSSPMAQFAWSAMTATTIANQRVFTFKILAAAIVAIAAEEESIFKKPITTITIIIVDIIIFSFNSIL